MNRAAVVLTLVLSTCGTPRGAEAPSPAPSSSAEASRTSEGTSPAPSSTEVSPGSEPGASHGEDVVRFEVDGQRYRIDLASPGTVDRCDAGDAEVCRPLQSRSLAGSELRDLLSAMAERAETETCPPEEGAEVQLDLRGRTLAFRLPPYPADRDYAPGDDHEECAARALVRSAMTIVSWE